MNRRRRRRTWVFNIDIILLVLHRLIDNVEQVEIDVLIVGLCRFAQNFRLCQWNCYVIWGFFWFFFFILLLWRGASYLLVRSWIFVTEFIPNSLMGFDLLQFHPEHKYIIYLVGIKWIRIMRFTLISPLHIRAS